MTYRSISIKMSAHVFDLQLQLMLCPPTGALNQESGLYAYMTF